ncbi:hypothetical protein VE01_10720 [Pseudogymnoascus verrucosus]|uniref:Uncharacterized protein n=1 Tax=Pseudogymnoascus verrucosus TaxID=342668 RepID=A0A1B8G646_9PEZI|nr:uncharacterized protein VE01_10720 [Pseudogymnoascus verrucosus]OBT91306.1 hypothetical protein VE01_10720 [Pseudogymnoascus verrucosus]
MTREAVATAIARLNCLEQQQDLLKTRGAKMLCRGLKTLDELEEVEERKRQEAEAHGYLASPSDCLDLIFDDLIFGLKFGICRNRGIPSC